MFEAPRQSKSAVVARAGLPAAAPGEFDFLKIGEAIWRGRATVLVATAASLLLAVLFVLIAPHQFTAVTEILIEPTDLRAVANEPSGSTQASDTALLQIDSQVRVLTSDEVRRGADLHATAKLGERRERRIGGDGAAAQHGEDRSRPAAAASRADKFRIMVEVLGNDAAQHLVGGQHPNLASTAGAPYRSSGSSAKARWRPRADRWDRSGFPSTAVNVAARPGRTDRKQQRRRGGQQRSSPCRARCHADFEEIDSPAEPPPANRPWRPRCFD